MKLQIFSIVHYLINLVKLYLAYVSEHETSKLSLLKIINLLRFSYCATHTLKEKNGAACFNDSFKLTFPYMI